MKRFEFACGGAELLGLNAEATRIPMNVAGPNRNVDLRISDISRAMVSHIPGLLIDLLEIAAYVYCGDQRAPRGSDTLDKAGSSWRRDLYFVIPVRHPEVWERPEIREALQSTLDFLSDDRYEFEFKSAKQPLAPAADYFDLTEGGMAAQDVALFSGGIDSLAGAIDNIVRDGRKTVLVGHHSAPKVVAAQRDLIERMKKAGHTSKLFYVPVKVTNSRVEPVETTQRSRSFLFACLAFAVARMFDLDRISFFENGVVSINLSPAHDVLGGRATRTTHPQVISGLQKIFSALAERSIEVLTPYLWATKTEVVMRIVEEGFSEFLPCTVSCAHPREWTREMRHCGRCSQCIDRRFAVLASGAGACEPAGAYAIDLLTGDRLDDDAIRMAVNYVKFCRELQDMTRQGFAANYPDVYAAAGHVSGMSSSQAIDRLWDLHRRHAQAVLKVVESAVQEYASDLVSGRLPGRSLLSMYLSRARLESLPVADTTQEVAEFVSRLEDQPCVFAVDDDQKRILFRGGFFLDGTHYRLFRELLGNHRQAKTRAGNQDIPYYPRNELAAKLGIDEAVLRRYVSQLRAVAIRRLTIDQGFVFEADGFIEHERFKGDRIDARLLEISLADLEAWDRRSQTRL